MGATADDIIAGKIVCQLKLAPPDVVRAALEALDAQRGEHPDVTVDLLSRGAIDKAGRTRVRRYVRLYGSVRRDAAYVGILERSRLVPKEKLDAAMKQAETVRYDPRLGEILVHMGELTKAQDDRLVGEVATVLEREDVRILESYRADRFDGVARAITKDRASPLDTGVFTIKKLFRSKESQRLARMAEAVRRETDKLGPPPTARITPAVPPPSGPVAIDGSFRRVAGYLLLRRLDAGGESELHLARHPKRDRPVALRLFPLAGDRTRFNHAALACRVEHENVVRVYEAGEADGFAFIAQELVTGESLRSLLDREGLIDPARGVKIVRQIARALDACHRAEIVHENVRASSVLLGTAADGTVLAKLGGFDAARVSSSNRAGFIEDLEALGGLLWETATGEPPPADESAPRTIAYARAAKIRNLRLSGKPEVPAALEELSARMLSPDPADRPRSAAHVVTAIDEIVLPVFLSGREDPARVGAAFMKIFSAGR